MANKAPATTVNTINALLIAEPNGDPQIIEAIKPTNARPNKVNVSHPYHAFQTRGGIALLTLIRQWQLGGPYTFAGNGMDVFTAHFITLKIGSDFYCFKFIRNDKI